MPSINKNELTQRLTERTRAASRDDLPDIYKQARDLEVRDMAQRVVSQAGRSASPEFLAEVAIAIAELANKRRG